MKASACSYQLIKELACSYLKIRISQVVVAFVSTKEAEIGKSLSLKLTWSIE